MVFMMFMSECGNTNWVIYALYLLIPSTDIVFIYSLILYQTVALQKLHVL